MCFLSFAQVMFDKSRRNRIHNKQTLHMKEGEEKGYLRKRLEKKRVLSVVKKRNLEEDSHIGTDKKVTSKLQTYDSRSSRQHDRKMKRAEKCEGVRMLAQEMVEGRKMGKLDLTSEKQMKENEKWWVQTDRRR